MYECIKHGVQYVLAGSIRDGGESPQPARVVPEEPLGQAPDQRRQRWLIVVAPGGVPRGDAEVELVPVIAVAVCGCDEQQKLGGGNQQDERPGDG